jgi:uncharacterized protein (TIGR00369 family)
VSEDALRAIDARADPRNVFARVPFTALMGMQRESSAGGRARFVLDARAELGNVIGAVHGGAVFTLVDVAMASAAVSLRDFRCTAVSLNVDTSFLQPGRGRLVCEGEVVAHDDQVAHCRAWVTDPQGQTVARALGSFRFLPFPASTTHKETTP